MLSKEQKARAGKLSMDLLAAFPWKDTAEGEDYWEDIHNRLLRISEEGQ